MSNRIKRTGGSKSSRVAREPLPEPLPTGPTKVVVADANPVVESVAAAAATGDPVRTLVALRQRLAAEVDAVDHPKELAVLASKLMETLDKLSARQQAAPADEGSAVDELNRRRQARRGAGA